MKYYLIAGEASGDLHGSHLMKALQKEDPQADFRFFGGDLMKAQGGVLSKHYSEMAFMGFLEVVYNLRTIFKNLKQAKQEILSYQPDAVILIDFPGFNLKVASFAKEAGFKVFYYISPKVWAWNEKRVLQIKKNVDRMFCILPFEVAFYKARGIDVDYVGNPLLDAIAANKPDDAFKIKHRLSNQPIIALLPGSREQEIKRILPVLAKVKDFFPGYQFVLAAAPSFHWGTYQSFLETHQISIVFNETYNLLLHAQAAIVTSGTATLETALLQIPQVVVYKGNRISVAIARRLLKIKFISLVNLIMDMAVVQELIQEDCNPKRINEALSDILYNKSYRDRMLEAYAQLALIIGKEGASTKTAQLMKHDLKD